MRISTDTSEMPQELCYCEYFIYLHKHTQRDTHLKVSQVFELREAQQGDEEIKLLFLMETELHECISFLCNQNHVSEINDQNYNS